MLEQDDDLIFDAWRDSLRVAYVEEYGVEPPQKWPDPGTDISELRSFPPEYFEAHRDFWGD